MGDPLFASELVESTIQLIYQFDVGSISKNMVLGGKLEPWKERYACIYVCSPQNYSLQSYTIVVNRKN